MTSSAPVKSRRQDIGWAHCQLIKDGEKVQLKCIYCGKVFKGGGIHRIKEHLANLKTGNASPCLRVPPAVRDQMHESLESITPKKRKRQKIGEDGMVVNRDAEPLACASGVKVQLVEAPENLEPSTAPGFSEGSGSVRGRGKKRGRKPNSANAVKNTEFVMDPVPINTNGLAVDPISVNTGAVVLNNSVLGAKRDNSVFGAKRVNNDMNMAIGRFLFDIGASLSVVNSVYFKPMIDSVVAGGVESLVPSQNDIQGSILKNSVGEVKADVDKISAGWGKTGCSLLVEQQKTGAKLLLNFLVDCPEGTVFLNSVDATSILSNSDAWYEMLKQVIVEVGADNVMQVITNDEELCVAAAKRLADSSTGLYWTPCAVSSLDLILGEFGKLDWINKIIEQARSFTRLVYNNSMALNIVRRHTSGLDIVEPAVTRAATNFTTLKRMVDLKQNLQSMVTSQEWLDCDYSRDGRDMLDTLDNQEFWTSCALITRLTSPLLRLLRIVDSNKQPAMGYVYAGMYRAKEAIKKEFDKKEEYMVYWEIIDKLWSQQWKHPLHVAGFYLNPKFFYSIEGDMPKDLHSGMLDCIEKLVPDTEVQDKIVKELPSYKNAAGDFGRNMAKRARDTLLPPEWWSTYGGSCPNLARLAIRILSQNCSLHGHNQNGAPYEKIHHVRNCLEHQRLRDLIFVQSNLRLKQINRTGEGRQNYADPISYEAISIVEDWVGEDVEFEKYSNSDWMALEQQTTNAMVVAPSVDEIDELGAGFSDAEIFETLNHE